MSETDKLRWVSAVIKEDRYRTEVITDTHSILADEPVSVGGTDLAPSPGDFLRISLATCTAITLRMYADRKQWDLKQIEVKVSTEDLGGKTLFRCDLHLTGNLDEQQRKRLIQIANACPVHKILTKPIEILTTLKEVNSLPAEG
jgi:putative redox protein